MATLGAPLAARAKKSISNWFSEVKVGRKKGVMMGNKENEGESDVRAISTT